MLRPALFVLCALSAVACEPFERARECKTMAQALAPVGGLAVRGDQPDQYDQAAQRARQAAAQLKAGHSSLASLEALRPELVSVLESLDLALRACGESLQQKRSPQYRGQQLRIRQTVQRFQGLANQYGALCR